MVTVKYYVVPIARAPAVYEMLGREWAAANGKVWNEERRGVVGGVSRGASARAVAKSITTGFVDYQVSADGTEAAFPVMAAHGVNMAAMKGLTMRGQKMPDDERELLENWFKAET